jgi:two-component system CheB/CheR fusion protein
LSIRNGSLHLAPPIKSDDRVHLPIGSFFASLAEDRGPSAIGVVLSGTGTDGTHGLAAIKAAGGITFVQDPASAKFDGMPRNALESGAADFCLSPEAIAAEIALVTQHPVAQGPASAEPPEEHMGPLRALIQGAFGIDVGHYNPNMIGRRLRRRMAIRRIERVDDYLRLCQTEPKELAALHRDLLISVTSFFRDREPFEVPAARVLPRIVAGKKDGDSIRIWVPGCASGEEPYSIAICLLEQLEASHRDVKVQIFGTDVDDEGLQQAQRGIYPARIAADVSPERLRRFFVRIDDARYQVSRRLRDTTVFSSHDLCQDAPFSRLDLVSCRNLLIYLKVGVQRNILRSFHRALLPSIPC